MNDNKKLSKKELKEKKHKQWVVLVTCGTFLSTILITYITDILLESTPLQVSFLILIGIIVLGILADIMGIAVTAVNIDPFNSMAAKKIKGAKTAVSLVKNAAQVSNVCNDVIGDICGIVSGATSVSIVVQLLEYLPALNSIIAGLIMSGAVAAFTVGGKACGKSIAMKNGTHIIHAIASILASIKILFKGNE